MSAESCLLGNLKMRQIRKIYGEDFEWIYSGFVNGICIPTEEVKQHARLHETSEKKGTASPINPTNEGDWIEVKNKVKKVRFMCQDQFDKKTSMNGWFGWMFRSSLTLAHNIEKRENCKR